MLSFHMAGTVQGAALHDVAEQSLFQRVSGSNLEA